MKKIHLQLKEQQKLWFTSDIHFGHRNVIKFCDRPFENEKEMNKQLVDNWNAVVAEDDIIFVLGDIFWFNDSHAIKRMLSKLNGNIYIIPGNHDNFESYHSISDETRITLCDDIVQVFLEHENKNLWDKKLYELWLSHYPLMTWPHREKDSINFFGHIHSKITRTEGVDQDLPLHKNQCDVGVDYWDYKPVQFEMLLEILK